MPSPTPTLESNSRCARCAAPFTCGMLAGEAACWCASLPPLDPVPGQTCLCRACLEKELKGAPPRG